MLNIFIFQFEQIIRGDTESPDEVMDDQPESVPESVHEENEVIL